jgi:hypothetical protein
LEADGIIKKLGEYEARLLVRGDKGIEIADPTVLAPTIIQIRTLLVMLVDKVAEAELDFKRSRAARLDKFLKEGMKRSPAIDSVRFEQDLIEKEIAADRLRNYMKYVDSLVSSVQTHIKVQTGIANNAL